MKTKLFLLFAIVALQSNAQCFSKISSGAYHTIAIANNGTLWAWGYNATAQVGNGTLANQTSPVQISTDTDWVTVDAGYYHSFAIKSNGTLWGWGYNSNRQLGDGTDAPRGVPTQIGTETNWAKISGGEDFSVAIKTNGTLWTWGSDTKGQMGNGVNAAANLVPTQIGTATDWAQIDAGRYHVIALNAGGGVFVWGEGGNGALGTGLGNDGQTPFLISGTAGVLKINACSRGSSIILSDNSLWTTGIVGNQNTYVFTKFQTANNWANISAGNEHIIATKTDGTLWAWGGNTHLQCSNSNAATYLNNPAQVAGTTYSTQISTNLFGSIALKTDGSLNTFGQNHVGQLAKGNLTNSTVSLVSCPAALSTQNFENINSIALYPNPVINTLNVSIRGNSEIQKLAIFDITGKQVKLQESNVSAVSVEDLKSGFYLLEITVDGQKVMKKFAKQ
jgi:alpha-tubulin suppressor-like RCC1 family protein